MRPTAPLALISLGLLALLSMGGAAMADEARWSRQVEVERPGTVVLELDGRMAERAEIDLGLIGPDGREVHFGLYGPEPAARQVRVTRVTQGQSGWQVELDAGVAPPRHDRLRFALAKEMAAAEVVLEGGGDGSGGGWRELARGSLFRLGAGDELQNFELSYPPTEVRLLRLTWPREAGLPELLATEILRAPGEGELYPVPIDCAAAGQVLDCTLDPPADCGALEVELVPREAPLRYDFYCACNGEWTDRGQGERRQHGHLRFELDGGMVHRLRLQSAVAPQVDGASCRKSKKRLVFEAATAGPYRLIYGRLNAEDRRVSANRPPEQEPAAPEARATLGPEIEGKAPEWPAAVEPGAPLAGEFQRSWPIEKSSARGQLVALTLPGEVGRLAGPVASGLRIDAEGRQLPFVYEAAPQPEKLLAATLRPERVSGTPGKSRAGIRIAGTGDRVELMLFATGPFERQLRFERREAPLRSQNEKELASASHWSCPASLSGSCRLRTGLGMPREEGELDFFVEFADGDNPPLREVEAEVWATRTVLYFVDPGGPLTLRWGSRLGSPSYDLASLRSVLPHHDAVAVRLGKELAGGTAEAPRWLLLAVIGVAAIALLTVLARILRQGPA